MAISKDSELNTKLLKIPLNINTASLSTDIKPHKMLISIDRQAVTGT